jgi:hypothetical protein
MHRTHMKYLLVAAGALAVGLLLAGTPVQSLLPFALVLACPLMMVFMMRGMHGDHGHGGGTHPSDPAVVDHSDHHDHPADTRPR